MGKLYPFSPLPYSPLFMLTPPFISRPLITARGPGERCKLFPIVGCGRSPSRQTIWCVLESKSAALVAAVFVDFPMNNWNKCDFLYKNKLDIVRRVQFLTGRRPMRSFSPAAVAAIAEWKSAPMLRNVWHVLCVAATCTESAIRLCHENAPHFVSENSDYSDLCK